MVADKHQDEVPQITTQFTELSEDDRTKRLRDLNWFINQKRALLASNAAAYAGHRRRGRVTADGVPVTVDKVVPGATFVPAHPTRYKRGSVNRKKDVKYFVMHRPGGPKKQLPSGEWVTMFPGEAGFNAEFKRAQARCNSRNTVYEFSQENRPASTHFVVSAEGDIIQMLDLDDESFHVLNRRHPTDRSITVTNANSIGIEIGGPIFDVFTGSQLKKCALLIRMMADYYNFTIDREHVFGHDEQDPARKLDPWKNFPYELVISTANRIPSFDFPAQFQTIDLAASSAAMLAQAKQRAFSFAGSSNVTVEAALDHAALQAADARTFRLATQPRSTLMQLQSSFSSAGAAVSAEVQAGFTALVDIMENTTPPVVKNATLFDLDTMTWRETE